MNNQPKTCIVFNSNNNHYNIMVSYDYCVVILWRDVFFLRSVHCAWLLLHLCLREGATTNAECQTFYYRIALHTYNIMIT